MPGMALIESTPIKLPVCFDGGLKGVVYCSKKLELLSRGCTLGVLVQFS